MARWLRRCVGAGLMAGCVAVGISACADNESSLFIRQVQAPSSSDCSFTSDPSSKFLLGGTMDLAFSHEYVAGLLLGNQLAPRGSSEQVRTETARFRAEGAEVRVETTDGAVIGEFTVPVTGFADPGNGSTPGWGVVGAVLVSNEIGGSLAGLFPGGASAAVGRIVAVVKVFGRTLGGQELESGEYRFPISICSGCLVSFPPDASNPDPALPQPNCLGASVQTGSSATIPCFLGQDEPIDCRICKAAGISDAICEPVPSGP